MAQAGSRVRLALVVSLVVAMLATGAALADPTAAGAAGCPAHESWTTFGFDNEPSGFNPCETVLSTSKVPSLHELWSAPLSGQYSLAQPTYAPGLKINGVAHDVVFVSDEHGRVQALDAATGSVLWTRHLVARRDVCDDIPDGRWGTSGAPELDLSSDTGYVSNGNDEILAIDLRTGLNRAGWRPVRVGTPGLDFIYGGITRAHGRLYVSMASLCDDGTYYGHVVAIAVATHSIVGTWTAVQPSSGSWGGGIWGPANAAVDPSGDVYVATGNSFPGEHDGYGERVVKLDPGLKLIASYYVPLVGSDVDYGATPLVFQPPGCPELVVAKNKSGLLIVFDAASIANGPTQTLQVASSADFQFNGVPAYSPATNMVYVSNSSDSDSDVYQHGMVAFQVKRNCTLALAWQQTVGSNLTSVSPPTVADGVVYYGDGIDNTLRAFNASNGTPLWDSGATITGNLYAAPTVVDGRVFVTAWDGHLYAFGPS